MIYAFTYMIENWLIWPELHKSFHSKWNPYLASPSISRKTNERNVGRSRLETAWTVQRRWRRIDQSQSLPRLILCNQEKKITWINFLILPNSLIGEEISSAVEKKKKTNKLWQKFFSITTTKSSCWQ